MEKHAEFPINDFDPPDYRRLQNYYENFERRARQVDILQGTVEDQREKLELLTDSISCAAVTLLKAAGIPNPHDLQHQLVQLQKTHNAVKESERTKNAKIEQQRDRIWELEKERNAAREDYADLFQSFKELDALTATLRVELAAWEGNGLPLCSICEEAPLEMCFINCGHVVSCKACTNKIPQDQVTQRLCPVCRMAHLDKNIIKLYFP